jgi:hypothetical protein
LSSRTPTRRAALAGLASALVLPGCAAWVHAGRDPGPPSRARGTGIGILVFEATANDFPFHTAAILETPRGRALYDPGGWWADGQGQRVGDVTHGLTPDREAAFLRRDYFGADPGDWRVHRFDRALDPAEAGRALELAEAMPPLVFGLCCWGLTSVLTRLDTFAGIEPWLLPGTLLRHLHTRSDLRYTTALVP